MVMMNEHAEKSLRTLELPRILERLSTHASSEAAKEAALGLRPAKRLDEALVWQRQTSAARYLIGIRSAPSFSGVRPVGASLQRAELGGSLNTRELLDIAGVLRCARVVKAYAVEDSTCLDGLFKQLQGNKHLEDKISGCILGEEELADNASPELASIRRHQRVTSGKVRETLQRYVSSPQYAKYLQDGIVTQRADRFVIPVKAEHRGDVPGLIHDVSSSGATLFVEPMAVVKLNNELRELGAKEAAEIERILAELTADCAAFGEGILRDYGALVALDGIFARGKLSSEQDGVEPKLSETGALLLRRARHPLLPARTAVPISLRLGEDFDTLVITGPNTGGKTVALKTIGLLSLMAACGLHIPADEDSCVPLWSAIYADVGDEQSIEQSLSTFSAHMSNIVSILAVAGPRSLILFDELGAGTDPVEGAALAVSIIEHARRLGACVAATTHYAELKTFALTAKGVENASCEFDVETLMPTFKLLIGVPGKSNAFAISRRLGLNESIIEVAREQVSTENTSFEEVLAKLEINRQALERERTQVEVIRREIEEDRRVARELREQLDKQREKAGDRARLEARRIVEGARATIDELLRELSRMRTTAITNEEMVAIRQKLNEAEDALHLGSERELQKAEPISRKLVAGDRVEILSMGVKATVLEPPDKDNMVRLQAGILSVTAELGDLRLSEADQPAKVRHSVATPARAAAQPECDLRGMTVEEAILSLEMYMDTISLSGMQTVRIIHGKGTGALRSAVHKELRLMKFVKTFRLGRYGEGEDGVTVVEMK